MKETENGVKISPKKKLHKVLKILSLLGFLLVPYPIFSVIAFFLSGGTNDKMALSLLSTEMICGLLGFLYGKGLVIYRNRASHSIKMILLILGSILLGGLFGGVIGLAFGWPALLSGIFCVFSFFICGERVGKNYIELLPDYTIFVTISFNLVAAFVFWLTYQMKGTPYSLSSLLFIFFLFTGIYAVVNNQGNIDALMKRGEHHLEQLPQKIRRYNLFLILILFGMIICCFLFRNYIGKGISFVASAIWKVVSLIFEMIGWLANLLLKSESSPTGQGEIPEIFLSANTESYFDWLTPFLLTVGLVLILWNIKKIIRFFILKWSNFVGILRRILGKERFFQSKQQNIEEYFDFEETIPMNKIIKEKRKKGDLRRWKREYKEFEKLTDSPEKLRLGYRLLLQWLKYRKIEISQSDTPEEILKKSSELLKESSAEQSTEDYEVLRYGEQQSSSQNIEETLKRIQNRKK